MPAKTSVTTSSRSKPKAQRESSRRPEPGVTNLAVDLETSKIVEQIFAWRVEGVGFRTIATRVTERGFPCPSAADRERNPHCSRIIARWNDGALPNGPLPAV